MRPITRDLLLCHCCHTGNPNPLLIDGLNFMQQILQAELMIASGYRCQKNNAAVGGAPHSEHLTGDAADIKAQGTSPLELYLAAEEYPPFNSGGIGLYPADYIHVDTRPARARWFRVAGHDYPITDYLTHAHAT